MKYNPKHIDLQGIRHAKETICALLEEKDDLLAALELAEKAMQPDYQGDFVHVFATIRAAIAKATGKEQP